MSTTGARSRRTPRRRRAGSSCQTYRAAIAGAPGWHALTIGCIQAFRAYLFHLPSAPSHRMPTAFRSSWRSGDSDGSKSALGWPNLNVRVRGWPNNSSASVPAENAPHNRSVAPMVRRSVLVMRVTQDAEPEQSFGRRGLSTCGRSQRNIAEATGLADYAASSALASQRRMTIAPGDARCGTRGESGAT
jgi:hypothetical protein